MNAPPPGSPTLPLLAPVEIIQPTMTQVAMRRIAGPAGKEFVLMQFATPAGVQFYFYEPEAFKQFIAQAQELVNPLAVANPQALVDAMAAQRKNRPR